MLYKPRDTDHYLKESKIQLAHFHSLNIIIATLGSELFNMPSYNSYLEAQNFSNALDKFRRLKTRILYLELPHGTCLSTFHNTHSGSIILTVAETLESYISGEKQGTTECLLYFETKQWEHSQHAWGVIFDPVLQHLT